MSTETLEEKIDEFLAADKEESYWRVVELHEKLIGPGTKQMFAIKTIVEGGVDSGKYERTIRTKNKRSIVGYRIKKRHKQTITSEDVGKVSDILGEGGWKRKE